MLQPAGKNTDYITGKNSVCFGAELWRHVTWKHSPGMLHAFSSSFAQSTGITSSRPPNALASVHVCLFMSVQFSGRYLKRLQQNPNATNSDDRATKKNQQQKKRKRSDFVAEGSITLTESSQRDLCPVSYLAISQHDDPHQYHVDFCSQWLIMVDLIHLVSQRKT